MSGFGSTLFHKLAIALVAMLAAAGAQAATITLVPGNGFADPTPATPEGGNTGTTLGQQRTILFNAAAQVWGTALTSSQEIKISAAFTALSCGPTSGVLGSAGATNNFALTAGPLTRFVPAALAEALLGTNINGGSSEINASFNATIDDNNPGCLGNTRWYYGLTGPAPANTFALYPTVLHEIGHGLGFAALLCTTSGGCGATPQGGYFSGIPDLWSDFLRDNNFDGSGANRRWVDLTNAQRVVSFTHDPLLVWDGMSVTANLAAFGQGGSALNEGRMRMYAPNPFQGGSSISHFHEDALPNLLMEPIADADVFTQTDLTDCLFADIGWLNSRCATVINMPPTLNAIPNPAPIPQNSGAQVVNLSGIGDGDASVAQALTITASSANPGLIPNPNVTYTSPNATGSLGYTPVAGQNGTALITVTVRDDGGVSFVNGGNDQFQRTFTVTVTSANTAPVANPISPPAFNEDTASMITLSYSDADGDLATTCAISSPTNVTVTTPCSCTGAGVCTVGVTGTLNYNGPASFGFNVTANAQTSNTASASLSITAVNDPPVINSVAPTTAIEDTLYSYNATRTDVDGPGQNWTLLGSHTCGGSIVAGTGAFSFTPAGPVPPASCVVAIQVCDTGTPNLCATQSTTVTISAVNDAPVINSVAPTTATEDTLYSYNATRLDPDGPGQSWTLLGTHTCGGSIGAGTGAFSFTPAGPVPPASCVVAIQICDTGSPNLCATQSTTVTITAVNDAPVINSVAPTTATEDTLYSYNATRNDPDGPGQSWTLLGTHTCGGSIGAGSGAFSFTPAGPVPPASCVVAIQVCDTGTPNLCATQSTTVTITAVNDAPVINSVAPTTATEDTLYSYNATRLDPDGPGQSWTLLGTHTCGGSIGAGSGAFSFTPAGPTPPVSCVVAIQVCDGGSPNECASQSTTVAITAVNDAPVIDSVAPASATEDVLYSYNATRNDPDGPGQNWTLLGTHTCGGSIGAGSGAFSFTPAGPVPPASCVVAIQVCDGGSPNECASQSTTVTIAAVNDAPLITSVAPTTATEDVLYSYTATSSDGDGPGQNWSLLGSHTCGGSIGAGSGAFSFTPAGPVPPASCVVAIQVCDGGSPNECASQSTTVTITAVNDAPVIDSVAPASATEDVLYSYNATRNDPDGPGQSWTLLGTHTCGGSIGAGSGAFSFTPTGPVPPASCVVAIQVCDGGSPDECASQSTMVTITAVNDAPTLDPIADPATIPADSGAQIVQLSGIGAIEPGQNLSVTATSDTPGLIPDPVVTYSSPGATGSLSYTPVPGQQGAAVITVTVTDDGGTDDGGIDSVSRSFVQQVGAGLPDAIFADGFE